MITPLQTTLCLYAMSTDLRFLNPVRNRMVKLLSSRLDVCELTTRNSHVDALLALKKTTEGLVVVFAHGTSDYLRGGEYCRRSAGESGEVEKFITRADLGAFKGKVVFCLSCDSNGLAQDCIDAGALAFVGFDEVPFNRFNAAGEPIGSYVLVKHGQELIAAAITAALERFLTGRATLDEAIVYLRLWINKTAVEYVRRNKSVKERREVAALFLRVKQGVQYHGPLGIRFGARAE